ncbi:membrane protein [Clostridium carboxidivorans P7]|uniref:AI-2E family transporter n=1 Tax=Clostridium carboxidivorans TaxID=217159 RepID=UPI0001D39309|nr:AI-2E family transporter [Clostridium carboxidivorans]AKN30731.1 membrane protein [Clostridium carboxidivorans P7]EFG88567.1 membrane protein, putative [Clostridium carboxidivorans P7]
MDFLKEFFSKESTKRFLFFVVLIIILYLVKSLLNMLLLTFLFTYLMNSLQGVIVRQLKKITPVREKLITILLYTLLFTSIVLIIVNYIPLLITETKSLLNQPIFDFNTNSNSDIIQKYLVSAFQQIDLQKYVKSGFDITVQLAANIGKWSANVFLAIMLSLFFMLEKNKIITFLEKFKTSKVSVMFKYFSFFGNNFLNSFGKVIQAQIVIAFANTIISVIMLSILKFPQLISLGFMIFILSLVPVAGVIISLIPLSLIAFKIGGFTKVLYVLIMVAVVHSLESYVLNPKLMSAKIELPIFFTFIILIASEHFMGVWGLLIGIPLVMFILDLLDVKVND